MSHRPVIRRRQRLINSQWGIGERLSGEQEEVESTCCESVSVVVPVSTMKILSTSSSDFPNHRRGTERHRRRLVRCDRFNSFFIIFASCRLAISSFVGGNVSPVGGLLYLRVLGCNGVMPGRCTKSRSSRCPCRSLL